MLNKIAEKMLLWKMDARLLGTAALLWCAHDAARLTLNGEPWSLKQLYMNFADKRDRRCRSAFVQQARYLRPGGLCAPRQNQHQHPGGMECAGRERRCYG